MFITDKDYVIRGISKENGKQMFIAIDPISGGYPYWTDYYQQAKHYKTPIERQDLIDSMVCQVTMYEVVEVQVVGTVVSSNDARDFARAEAQKKIDAIKKELDAQIANLEKI